LLFANRKLLIVESALIYFMRSRVTILIAAAIIASVLAAGCTSSTQNQSTSQSASSTTHDPVLQAVINDDLQAYNNASWVRTLNQSIQWINATSAMVTYRVTNPNAKPTLSLTYTAQYTKFASVFDASNYVTSIDQGYNATTAAELVNFPALTTASSTNTHQSYLSVTKSLPSTVSYIKMQGDQPTSPASYIIQVSNVVITFNATLNEGS
jgi:outer membrane murein-binding lipoprotein Lpp